MIQRFSLAFVLVLVAALAFAGCRGGAGGKKTPAPPSATATAGAQPSATPDLAPSQAIRSVVLRGVGAVRALEVQSGGARLEEPLVIYADVTGDGNEEAVVPVTLGGKQSIMGFVVLTMDGTRAKSILSELPRNRRSRLALKVEGGKVIETQSLPGSDDPECCPSTLEVTAYAWNGSALVVESVNTIPNPAGGVKGTPPATP
jgi:hypothetical protein